MARKQFSADSKILFVICLFAALMGPSKGIPLNQQGPRDFSKPTQLKGEIADMRRLTDQALTKFIRDQMDCTTIEACRSYVTSLRLTNLPSVDIPQQNNNWNSAMEKNLKGLQDFNYYLQSVFGSPSYDVSAPGNSQRQDGYYSVNVLLTEVANLLFQFMGTFQDEMETTYCRPIVVRPLSDYPPCEICNQPSLPSPSLEVIRNYHFLMQFDRYLENFLNLYNLFLFSVPVPTRC